MAGFLSTLETLEGDEAPLTPEELSSLRTFPSFAGRAWVQRGTTGSLLVGLGAYYCQDGPELFTACLPDHREMSLFLPMLQWADARAARTHACPNLTVWAWEHDICTPYLLLRLNFTPGQNVIRRGETQRVPYLAPVGQVTALTTSRG